MDIQQTPRGIKIARAVLFILLTTVILSLTIYLVLQETIPSLNCSGSAGYCSAYVDPGVLIFGGLIYTLMFLLLPWYIINLGVRAYYFQERNNVAAFVVKRSFIILFIFLVFMTVTGILAGGMGGPWFIIIGLIVMIVGAILSKIVAVITLKFKDKANANLINY